MSTFPAAVLARALGGHKAGNTWIACCPAHDDRTPSLSIRDAGDGKVLVRCHAGCGQEQVISILRSRGLWTSNGPRSYPTQRPNVQHEPDQDDTKRTEVALTIWQATTPANNTVVESYLALARPASPAGFDVALPSRLKHPSGGIWPVMVALVTTGLGRNAARHSPHVSCPRRRRQGAGRSGEDDARSMSRRRGAPRPAGRLADDR